MHVCLCAYIYIYICVCMCMRYVHGLMSVVVYHPGLAALCALATLPQHRRLRRTARRAADAMEAEGGVPRRVALGVGRAPKLMQKVIL